MANGELPGSGLLQQLNQLIAPNTRFSELGDVVTKQTNLPFFDLPFNEQIEDVRGVLGGKRSLGQEFDNLVFSLFDEGLSLEDITRTTVGQQRLSRKPLQFKGITRQPTEMERFLRGLLF